MELIKFIKIKKIVRSEIDKYINENKHLLSTDDAYNINCGLKPRIVVNSIAKACRECKKGGYVKHENSNDCYLRIFEYGTKYATKYLSKLK